MTPKNIQALADQKIDEIVSSRSFEFETKWKGKRFGRLKLASSTEKGDIGEDFLREMLEALRYKDIEVLKGRKGHFDVGVKNGKKHVKFEVKTATLDTRRMFQFNGIRYDTKYTHLFFFGVLLGRVCYEIVPKEKLDTKGYTMTPMRRGTNSDFKITRPSDRLSSFGTFGKDVIKLLGAPK